MVNIYSQPTEIVGRDKRIDQDYFVRVVLIEIVIKIV